jgi:hypothetical protein
MALYPSTFTSIIGFQPVMQVGYLALRQQSFLRQKGLALFGNDNIEPSSDYPANTVGIAPNLILPLDGGSMLMDGSGSGTMTADLYPTRAMEIDFTGSGDLEANAGLVISMLLNMIGSGTLTAGIVGNLNMTADFTGSGDLDANLSGLGNMIADLDGSGDLDAVIAAYGDMTVDIVVTGTGLSTANVGQAVWAAIAALNNEPGSMGEKLNLAGSGGVDYTALANAVLAAAALNPITANIKEVNDLPIDGAGTEADPFGPV